MSTEWTEARKTLERDDVEVDSTIFVAIMYISSVIAIIHAFIIRTQSNA